MDSDDTRRSSEDEWNQEVAFAKKATNEVIAKMSSALQAEACRIGYQFLQISDDDVVACARRITGKAAVAPTTFKNLRRAQSTGVRDAVNIDDIKATFSVSDLFFVICGISVPL
jgi:hypothetical protein